MYQAPAKRELGSVDSRIYFLFGAGPFMASPERVTIKSMDGSMAYCSVCEELTDKLRVVVSANWSRHTCCPSCVTLLTGEL